MIVPNSVPDAGPRRIRPRPGQVAAVAVRASDPMTRLGATSLLKADQRVTVVVGKELAFAEVIVVLEKSVDHRVFGFLREARARSRLESPPRCVLVTEEVQPDVLMTAIECGVVAMLRLRRTEGDELVRTVLAVRRGEASLPPRLQSALLGELDRIRREVLEPNGLTLSGPSARERDVLRLLAEGHDTEEIAAMLPYSVSTVKNVLHGLMTRYGLRSRSHAVAFALRTAII